MERPIDPMTQRITYTDEPMQMGTLVNDVLHRPPSLCPSVSQSFPSPLRPSLPQSLRPSVYPFPPTPDSRSPPPGAS